MKFKMPTKSNLKSRKSTIANAFAISITPYDKEYTEEDIEMVYKKLKIKENQCAYCLGEANTTDHFMPLVIDGEPTGYITNIFNLVPCCSSCNSAKGGRYFNDWYLKSKNIERLKRKGLKEKDIKIRNEILKSYDKEIIKLDYKLILGKDYKEYLKRMSDMKNLLDENQEFCDKLRCKVEEEYLKIK